MPEESTARYWEREYVTLMDSEPGMRALTTGVGPACRGKSPIVAMWNAFKALPNLQTLTVAFPEKLLVLEQRLLFAMLPAAWPGLSKLRLDARSGPLDFLTRFRELQHLALPGYSTSTPDEMLGILRSMPNLDTLALEDTRPRIQPSPTQPALNRSITSEVISGTESLRRFHLSYPSPLLDLELLKALQAHANTLEELSVDTTDEKHTVVLDVLLNVVKAMGKPQTLFVNVNILPLDDFDCICSDAIADHLPPSLQRCEFKSPSRRDVRTMDPTLDNNHATVHQ